MSDVSPPRNVGFIGFGTMGCAMARHVLAVDHTVGHMINSLNALNATALESQRC